MVLACHKYCSTRGDAAPGVATKRLKLFAEDEKIGGKTCGFKDKNLNLQEKGIIWQNI